MTPLQKKDIYRQGANMKIEIAYDGEAVRNGDMDIEELAPALLSLGKTLQEANLLLNNDSARLKVNVKSDFKTGSFQVALEVVQSLSQQASFTLDGIHLWSAKEIAEFLGLTAASGISVIKFTRWLKNRKIKSTTTLESGDIEIERDDGEKIITSPSVLKMTKSVSIRTSLQGVFRPLSKDGIDFFFVRHKTENIETITKSDIEAFVPPNIEDVPLTDNVRTAAYQLIGVVFEDSLKWRLSDSDSRISAEMRDESFQRRVDNGLRFGKGDILVLKLRTKQVQTATGVKNEHTIEEVINHIPKSVQGELPL